MKKEEAYSVIFGKNSKVIFNNLVKLIRDKKGFCDVYIANAFLILLSHVSLDVKLEEIIIELSDSRRDNDIIKKIVPFSFKRKLEVLKNSLPSFLRNKLDKFNTTRNAFAHAKKTGDKDYKKFLPSHDLSREMLTPEKYNEILKMEDDLENILRELKNNK